MISFPNAKINLGLNVVARRSDGYHDIGAIFLLIGIWEINDADNLILKLKELKSMEILNLISLQRPIVLLLKIILSNPLKQRY